MISRYCLCLVALAALGVAGCETTSVAMVVQSDSMTTQNLNIAPTIPLQLKDGKTTTLTEIAAPFYLVAFVEAPAGQADYVNPDVFAIAKEYNLESISVVQITEPAEGQTIPEAALQQCSPPDDDNMILVLDPNRQAWKQFNKPALGTLLLINRRGDIAEKGTLADFQAIQFQAFEMAKNWDEKQFNESFGDED